jgi:hypothetical protein
VSLWYPFASCEVQGAVPSRSPKQLPIRSSRKNPLCRALTRTALDLAPLRLLEETDKGHSAGGLNVRETPTTTSLLPLGTMLCATVHANAVAERP